MAKTFQLTAEYLHTMIGRRVGIPLADSGYIPITVGSVRHDPESGLILVDALVPMGQLTGLMLTPDAVVEVEHTS